VPRKREAPAAPKGAPERRKELRADLMRTQPVALSSISAFDPAAGGFDVARLRAPDEALRAFFAAVALRPRGRETARLEAALGRVLAEDVVARDAVPSHARSMMDGYALASAGGMAPRRVVGEIRMGRPAERGIGAGEAIRIPTGGALPPGADAVWPQEDCALDGERVVPDEIPEPGANVTPAGEDVALGETVLRAGRRIGAPELGLLATLGVVDVPVFVRPSVAIVSTGDELVDPGERPAIGQVRDSNRFALAAALQALGAEPIHRPRAPDTPEGLRAELHAAVATADAVLLTGGSSVGERDLVPRIAAEFAPGPIVHGIRVRPGKPTMLAAAGDVPIVGLPGNPSSAYAIFEAIARPIVLALVGDTAPIIAYPAIAAEPFVGRAGWTWFVPASLRLEAGRLLASPLRLRSSHASLHARASGYAVVGETPWRVEPGEPIVIEPYSAGGAPLEVA